VGNNYFLNAILKGLIILGIVTFQWKISDTGGISHFELYQFEHGKPQSSAVKITEFESNGENIQEGDVSIDPKVLIGNSFYMISVSHSGAKSGPSNIAECEDTCYEKVIEELVPKKTTGVELTNDEGGGDYW
jgi:hypothetical protein